MIFPTSVEGFNSADDDTAIVEVNEMSAVLMNLDKYCKYSVRVASMTSVGVGPWSEPIICHTAEDGKGCWSDVFLWCHLIKVNSVPLLRKMLVPIS
jgi:hypothetical protein